MTDKLPRCPHCGEEVYYIGLKEIDCLTIGCPNFNEKAFQKQFEKPKKKSNNEDWTWNL